jgi:transposase
MGCHQANAAERASWDSTSERPPYPQRIFWVLRSGAPWRDLPDSFGPYTTYYNRFVRWRRVGVWGRIMEALAIAHDASVQMIDTSIVRVHRASARCLHQSEQKTIMLLADCGYDADWYPPD